MDIARLKVTICFPIHKPVYCPLSSFINIRKQEGLGFLGFFITRLIALIPCHWMAIWTFSRLWVERKSLSVAPERGTGKEEGKCNGLVCLFKWYSHGTWSQMGKNRTMEQVIANPVPATWHERDENTEDSHKPGNKCRCSHFPAAGQCSTCLKHSNYIIYRPVPR